MYKEEAIVYLPLTHRMTKRGKNSLQNQHYLKFSKLHMHFQIFKGSEKMKQKVPGILWTA